MASRKQQDQVDVVHNMLVNMVPYSEIERQLSARWRVSRKRVHNLIKLVLDEWSASSSALTPARRHQIRGGFEALFLRANQKGDIGLAARILGELAKLDGCYAPTQAQVNVTGAMGVGVGINLGGLGFKSADEVRDRIEELRGRLAKQGPSLLQPHVAQHAATVLASAAPVDAG